MEMGPLQIAFSSKTLSITPAHNFLEGEAT
jgi:hypothetical protein